MVNFYNIDNIDFMRSKPDKYYDLAIVDPPYGLGVVRSVNGNMTLNKTFNNNFDKWDIKPKKQYFEELFRISKNQIIFGGNHFTNHLPESAHWIVWDKKIAGNRFSNCELIWTSFGISYNEKEKMSIRKLTHSVGKKYHLTGKPVSLYIDIISRYAKNDFKLIDTNGGSATIAIAKEKINLNLTLDICETNDVYYKQSISRYTEFKKQLKLF
jgi:site-specific DNA-methyltransferase (adenine-specific)